MTEQRRHPPVPTRANDNTPLLTLERAIADGIAPLRLRRVAEANRKAASGKNPRLELQAANLIKISERLELLGYRSAA